MLNEKRVKHMVKLALYETKNGKEEIKASGFYKKDYVVVNVLRTAVWMTIGYVFLTILLLLSFMHMLVEDITMVKGIFLIVFIVVLYVGLLITYIFTSRRFYKEKHKRAYYHVKDFKENLEELETMYEKEDIDE